MIPFTKMYGLGNDFIILDSHNIKDVNHKNFIKSISDRRTGIGCDQVIVWDYKTFEMKIFNQDGSEAGACGNGTRCLAKIIHDKFNITSFEIKTQDRSLHCDVFPDLISVNMGKALKYELNDLNLINAYKIYEVDPSLCFLINVGNEHLVILNHKPDENFCKFIERNNIFPNGININFAQVTSEEIKLKVWERGVSNFTLACGSGACASFFAAFSEGLCPNTFDVKFDLGALKLKIVDDNIIMQGSATKVFEGFI